MRAYSSPNTKINNNKQKNIKRQMSGVMCHLSPATCHLSVMPTAQSQTLPLLTPPLCTVGLFAKTKKLRFFFFPYLFIVLMYFAFRMQHILTLYLLYRHNQSFVHSCLVKRKSFKSFFLKPILTIYFLYIILGAFSIFF